jgi:magnesium transporter
MSGAASRADAELDDPATEVDGERAPRAGIHAYARTASGVHAISVDAALEIFRRGPLPAGAEGSPLVWIDVAAPGDAEAAFLRDQLHFHPLAVEDCIRGRQRPKLDRYPGHIFLVLYAARINRSRDRMALNEMHAFVGQHYIVTVHDQRIPELSQVLARWRGAPDRYDSSGVIAHAVVDLVVDGYFPVIDHFSERVARLETDVIDDPRENMKAVVAMRRELILFRRIVGPEREMLGNLLRREMPFQGPDLLPYFQDVYDHAIRVAEEIDTLRDLITGAMEAQLSMASNQLNEAMRLMAAWAIILMAMAWIAGIYGMNFERMPELSWPLGYGWALGVMGSVGGVLFVYFRRRRWI